MDELRQRMSELMIMGFVRSPFLCQCIGDGRDVRVLVKDTAHRDFW